MRTLFGVSHEALLLALAGVSVVVIGVMALAVWRNPLLLRLAWRNVPLRPGFAALITLGLTLGTIILSSAFTTGDTMAQSVRGVVAGVLGSADEVVFIPAAVRRSGFELARSIASGTLLTGVTGYFPAADVQKVADVVADDARVAAVIPVVLDLKPVSSEGQAFGAQINLLGLPDETPFTLQSAMGATQRTINELGANEVYVNTEAATALGATVGQRIRIYDLPAGAQPEYVVKDVTRLGDLGGGQATVFLPMARLQELEQRADQVNQVFVVNAGDGTERLANSWPITVKLRAAFIDDATARRFWRGMSSAPARDLVARALTSPDTSPRLADKLRRLQRATDLPDAASSPEFKALVGDPELLSRLASRSGGVVTRGSTPFGAVVAGYDSFRVIDVQSIAQDQADLWGSAFTDLFVVLGAFSIFSGMLLIVLVFSLVALERRSELGITRALGARRSEVIMLLAIEGGIYSLISSLFGLGGGLALALGIIGLAQGLVATYGFHLQPTVESTSIAASYGLGVVLTFCAVSSTAWRSSRFSIVTAIRDAPDQPSITLGWRDRIWSVVPVVGGPLVMAVALVILQSQGSGPNTPVRIVGAGVALLLGAVWVIASNARLVRVWDWAPAAVGKLSGAYVAANRFRTGLTLAMFGLVVLSMTVSAVMLTVTRVAYADPDAITGGWDIHAQSTLPPRNVRADLAAARVLPESAFNAIGAASPITSEAIQTDASGTARWAPVDLLVVDEGFVDGARTPLVGGSARWSELMRPGTAIVGAGLLSAGASGRLQVVTAEGSRFHPIRLWLRDTRTKQRTVGVEVIGLADARGPFASSVLVGAGTLNGWPPAERAGYYLSVSSGANARDLAAGLSLALPDLTARTIGDELRLVQGVRGLMNMILQGFMGVGLLAGIAALGTLSTRAVVERRRQIGVLRAVGFTSRAISMGLLVESGVIALLGAGLGVGVGLFVAQRTLAFLARVNPELRFSIPWEQLGLVVLLAVAAASLMTVLPARQAARLTPAEALREM